MRASRAPIQRRPDAHPPGRPARPNVQKLLRLSPEVAEALDAEAVRQRRSQAVIADDILRDHLRSKVVSWWDTEEGGYPQARDEADNLSTADAVILQFERHRALEGSPGFRGVGVLPHGETPVWRDSAEFEDTPSV